MRTKIRFWRGKRSWNFDRLNIRCGQLRSTPWHTFEWNSSTRHGNFKDSSFNSVSVNSGKSMSWKMKWVLLFENNIKVDCSAHIIIKKCLPLCLVQLAKIIEVPFCKPWISPINFFEEHFTKVVRPLHKNITMLFHFTGKQSASLWNVKCTKLTLSRQYSTRQWVILDLNNLEPIHNIRASFDSFLFTVSRKKWTNETKGLCCDGRKLMKVLIIKGPESRSLSENQYCASIWIHSSHTFNTILWN